MVNPSGNNGIDNGEWPSDEELEKSLRKYALKGLTREMRLLYLKEDHGLIIGKETLRKLNNKFNIPSVRKPPAYPVSKTLVCNEISKDISQRNGPRQLKRNLNMTGVLIPRDTVRKIAKTEAPNGAELRDPATRKAKKIRGHLTGYAIMQEVHNDGHAKLGPLALRMGGVGILIYACQDHSSGSIRHAFALPNDRNEYAIGHFYLDFVELNDYIIPLQETVDGGTEVGWLLANHCALRRTYLPDLDETKVPATVQLKSTDNISIESVWSYWLKFIGETLRTVIVSGHTRGFFIVGNQLHFQLFQWLWPKIVQKHLDDFKMMFNSNPTRSQRGKLLPSGVSPEFVYDFPENFELENVGCRVEPEAVAKLRGGMPVSREEAFRWVSDEFDLAATAAYEAIGAPKLECDVGWAVFNKMVHLLDNEEY